MERGPYQSPEMVQRSNNHTAWQLFQPYGLIRYRLYNHRTKMDIYTCSASYVEWRQVHPVATHDLLHLKQSGVYCQSATALASTQCAWSRFLSRLLPLSTVSQTDAVGCCTVVTLREYGWRWGFCLRVGVASESINQGRQMASNYWLDGDRFSSRADFRQLGYTAKCKDLSQKGRIYTPNI